MAADEPVADPPVLLVDASNVVGAGARGWWRDRPAAVARLADRLAAFVTATGQSVELVLDAPDLPEGARNGVAVHHARRRGRDAADDRIRELLGERPGPFEVITSDRALREDAQRLGAGVVGAGTFLARLDDLGL